MPRHWLWACARWLHHFDYAVLLPGLSRLPLFLGFAVASLRGRLNAMLGRDWRSMALGSRHIFRMSLQGAQELATLRSSDSDAEDQRAWAWARQRFEVEARDEFEAWLMHERRWPELQCRFEPHDAPARLCAALEQQGVVLLTPHFDSFYLGIAFLAHHAALAARNASSSGGRLPVVNAMASAVPQDPRVDPAVSRHFDCKYRGLEQALNGGLVVDMEDGVRPFYRMLQQQQALVVLADAPVLPQGAEMHIEFLGQQRRLAGGAQRLAQRTGALVGAFVCEHESGSRYVLRWCEPDPATDPQTMKRAYDFLGQAIMHKPGRWWGMDLLPNLPVVQGSMQAPMQDGWG